MERRTKLLLGVCDGESLNDGGVHQLVHRISLADDQRGRLLDAVGLYQVKMHVHLLIGFSQGLAVGAGVVVSQFLGAKDHREAQEAVGCR